MFIHQNFKDDLKRIRPDLQAKFGLQNPDTLPDAVLLEKLVALFSTNEYPTSQARLTSDTNNSYYIYLILGDLKSIDDTFIRHDGGLFRRDGLVDLINTIEEELNEAQLFKVGKVCRVCAMDKLRTLSLSNLRDYIGRHFEVIGYEKTAFDIDPNEMINSLYAQGRYRKVYCKDGFGNKFVMPQCILVPTSIKDLRIHEEKIQLEKILYRLNDTAKYDLEVLSETYSNFLRQFMEASKKLQQKMTKDFTTEAKQILDMQLNLKDRLIKNKQITAVSYVISKELTFETVPLRCTDPEVPTTSYPIGRYKVWINLVNRDLKIHNIDIGSTSEYQHPHIQGSGTCCLGERVNPLRESYSKTDRVTLAGGIIAYIEHLNPRSVYRSMNDFQTKNSKLFQYQVDQKKTPEYGEVTSVQNLSDDSLELIATVAEMEARETFTFTEGGEVPVLVTDGAILTISGNEGDNGVDHIVGTEQSFDADGTERTFATATEADMHRAQADSDRIDEEQEQQQRDEFRQQQELNRQLMAEAEARQRAEDEARGQAEAEHATAMEVNSI